MDTGRCSRNGLPLEAKKKKKKEKAFLTYFFSFAHVVLFLVFDVIIVLFRFNRAGVSHEQSIFDSTETVFTGFAEASQKPFT